MTYKQIDIVSLIVSILLHLLTATIAILVNPMIMLAYLAIVGIGFYTAYSITRTLADKYIVLKSICWTVMFNQYIISILLLTYVNVHE